MMLFERDAKSLWLAPHDLTRRVVSVCQDQGKLRRDTYGAFDFKHRACVRQVAHSAIDRAARELDGSGSQHAAAMIFMTFH